MLELYPIQPGLKNLIITFTVNVNRVDDESSNDRRAIKIKNQSPRVRKIDELKEGIATGDAEG